MSEHYRALTRKYRPSTFDDIVSQEHVSSTLKNAIEQNRLSHAYLFSGPRGVGKTTMARVLARTINNLDQQISGEHLNLTLNVVEIDAASNNKVDDIHHLRESVRIPPQNGRYKVFIIDEVHMLSTSAFNALLKTLEEPPEHAIFIFATTEPHKVLPTILSRVQRFDFKRIRVEEMVKRLQKIARKEDLTIDDESLHVIAKKADGALRDALSLLDQAVAFCGQTITHEELLKALNVVSTDRLFEFTDCIVQRDANAGLTLIDNIMLEGYDIEEFLVELTEHLRNMYIAVSSASIHLIEAAEATQKSYKKAAEQFNANDVMRMLHVVSEAQFKIREAHQPRILFETTLLKLIHMSRGDELRNLIEELRSLKKKRPDINNTPPDTTRGHETANAESQQESAESKTAATPKKRQRRIPPGGNSASLSNKFNKVMGYSDNEGSSPFDNPTLGGTQSESETELNQVDEPDKTSQSEAAESPKEQSPPVYLHTLKELWPTYLEKLKEHVPPMLYMLMQRTEPVDLKNNTLVLRCNDAFAERMIEENKPLLGRLLKQVCGGYVRIMCEVRNSADENGQKQSLSPYERFKKLQEKDPKIRAIVELFGAELDY